MTRYLKLMRVHHYMKNLLVFAALVASGELFDASKLGAGVLGFVAPATRTACIRQNASGRSLLERCRCRAQGCWLWCF